MSRRQVLRGSGVALSLPWLESMCRAAGTRSEGNPPLRMAFLYVPNGVDVERWKPEAEGPLPAELPAILAPLAPHRDDLLVISGLAADKARAHGDGGGDHARAMAAYLTGTHPRKTGGSNILAGVSADQIAASAMAAETRLPSLELGCEAGGLTGNCDSGYACVYSSTLAWRSPTQPLPKEVNPRLAFERLVGRAPGTDRGRRSVLDFIRDDVGRLEKRLGGTDRRRLDEYFTSLRELEARIDRLARLPAPQVPAGAVSPAGIPESLDLHIRLMCDLLVLAFQTDCTRVCTFAIANEGSNRAHQQIGINEGHHELSHHGGDAVKREKIARINTFHTTQFAYLVSRLAAIREGEGTLLDHCMIAYGSGNSDGDKHLHHDLPILLAGRGGGTIRPGRHLVLERETPVTNLWLSMLARMGIEVDSIGDSTGPLDALA